MPTSPIPTSNARSTARLRQQKQQLREQLLQFVDEKRKSEFDEVLRKYEKHWDNELKTSQDSVVMLSARKKSAVKSITRRQEGRNDHRDDDDDDDAGSAARRLSFFDDDNEEAVQGRNLVGECKEAIEEIIEKMNSRMDEFKQSFVEDLKFPLAGVQDLEKENQQLKKRLGKFESTAREIMSAAKNL